MPSRLRALAAALSALLLGTSSQGQDAPGDLRVTLLGTGSPVLSLVRFGPSILAEAGDQTLVFDVGRGAAQRLAQLGVSLARVDAIFLTHLHSDHVVGLPDLWLTGWVLARRTVPWEVYGPAGTAAMAEHLAQAFAFNARLRVADGGRDPAGGRLVAHEVRPGVVYEHGGVRVIAFEVDHGLVRPAYGFRIEYGGRVAVLSGDTRFSEPLIAAARGADLLVHEVVLAPPDIGPSDSSYRAFAHHTTPEQAAAVFARVTPALAVYSHVVVFNGLDESEILTRTRAGYAGPVVLGQDLMSVRVGDAGPTPRPRNAGAARRP